MTREPKDVKLRAGIVELQAVIVSASETGLTNAQIKAYAESSPFVHACVTGRQYRPDGSRGESTARNAHSTLRAFDDVGRGQAS
jgi:hypothetical protein